MTLIDLREPQELQATGRIPGSVAAPRGMLEFYADTASSYHRPEFDPSRRIILTCAGGGRSALAAVTLQEMGYDNVAHLESGVNGWIAEGRLRWKETILEGIENAPRAFIGLFKGENFGKMLVKIGPDQ